MAASSNYFKTLLGPSFCEGEQKLVTLREIDGPTLKHMIDFVYTGRVRITDEHVWDIIAAASSMELVVLESECGKFWKKSLSIVNCVDILLAADKYQLWKLTPKVQRFICRSWLYVQDDELAKIDAENFRKLLQRDDVDVDEVDVFDSVVQWLSSNNNTQKDTATTLLKLVRLPFIESPVSCHAVRC